MQNNKKIKIKSFNKFFYIKNRVMKIQVKFATVVVNDKILKNK